MKGRKMFDLQEERQVGMGDLSSDHYSQRDQLSVVSDHLLSSVGASNGFRRGVPRTLRRDHQPSVQSTLPNPVGQVETDDRDLYRRIPVRYSKGTVNHGSNVYAASNPRRVPGVKHADSQSVH